MLMPPIGNTITLFCSLKNWLNVWKSFLRGKKPGLRHQQTCCLLFYKILWVHFFPFFKKTKGKKKDELPVTKNKSFFLLTFFPTQETKKQPLMSSNKFGLLVGLFVCAPSLPLFTFVFSPFLPEKRKKKKHTKRERWSTYILGQTLSEPRTASSPA